MIFSCQPFEIQHIERFEEIERECLPAKIRFSKRKIVDLLSRSDIACYSFVAEKKIAGYFLLQVDSFRQQANIISLNVGEGFRNMGLGKQMLDIISLLCTHLNLKKTVVQVEKKNEGLVRFFKSYHFTVCKELVDYLYADNEGLEMELVFNAINRPVAQNQLSSETDQNQLSLETDHNQLSPETDQNQLSLETDQNQLSLETDQNQLSPDTDQNQLSPDTDQSQLSPDTDQSQLSPDTDQSQLSPETDQSQLSLETDHNQLSPDTDQNQLSLETDQNQLSSETDQKLKKFRPRKARVTKPYTRVSGTALRKAKLSAAASRMVRLRATRLRATRLRSASTHKRRR